MEADDTTARWVKHIGRKYAARTMDSNKYVCIIKSGSIIFANGIIFQSKQTTVHFQNHSR